MNYYKAQVYREDRATVAFCSALHPLSMKYTSFLLFLRVIAEHIVSRLSPLYVSG